MRFLSIAMVMIAYGILFNYIKCDLFSFKFFMVLLAGLLFGFASDIRRY